MNKRRTYTINKKTVLYLLAGSFILLFLVVSPVLCSGYISDDALNSQVPGILANQQTNVISFSFYYINQWLTSPGRFYPLAFLFQYTLFSIVSNLVLYKLFLVFMILVNTLLLFYLVKIISKRLIIAIFSVLFIPIFLKITLAHNPILSFGGLMQWVLLFVLLSLIALVYYLKNGSKYYLVLSMLFYFISLMFYEISYTLFILHVVIIFLFYGYRPLLFKIRTSLFVFSMALLAFCITISLRLYHGFSLIPVNSGPYSFNLSIGDFLLSMVHSLVAVIPLSYTILDPNKIFNGLADLFKSSSLSMIICIGIVSFALFYITSKVSSNDSKNNEIKSANRLGVVIFGISLTVLPLVFLGVSTRWQFWGGLGNAYLPIYLSAFGGCICAISIYDYILKKIATLNIRNNSVVFVLFSLLFSFICVLTYSSNTIVVKTENISSLSPRQIIEDGMDNGLFKGIPEGSNLVINDIKSWDQLGLYRMHTGIRFGKIASQGEAFIDQTPIKEVLPQTKAVDQSDKSNRYSFTDEDKYYYLDYSAESEYEGKIIVCKINDISIKDNTILSVAANDVKIFVKSNQLNSKSQVMISGQWINPENKYEPLVLNENDMVLVSQGKQWKMFTISQSNLRINPLSLKIYFTSKNQNPLAEWQGGFSGLEGTPDNNWRWCSSQGNLIIINPTDKEKRITFNATFKTGFSEMSNLNITSALMNADLKINDAGYDYKKEIVIPPGGYIVNFSCDAERLNAPGDPRTIIFGVFNFQMLEIK